LPRVSDAHRAARREQVLDAARRAFSANGFHATSMDDVIKESGLSAGAVYQYFRGKDDLIVAAATEALGAIRHTLDTLDEESSREPAAALARVLESWPFAPGPDGVDMTRLALHGWSEATRNPRLHALVDVGFLAFEERVGQLVAGWQAAGTVRADLDPKSITPPLLSLLLGYVVQRALFGAAVDPAAYERGLAVLLS
jgi:AcrR family transcriptional regulator